MAMVKLTLRAILDSEAVTGMFCFLLGVAGSLRFGMEDLALDRLKHSHLPRRYVSRETSMGMASPI